ncbi:MAG TPA: DUF5990 family protein [Mycobacterium sp.]|nr:DUF5990 family protein [Mycobacterium sp.]
MDDPSRGRHPRGRTRLPRPVGSGQTWRKRFIYLTWGDVGKDGSFAMFRRAKLMLSELEAFAGNAESVIAGVDLTDKRGGPQCARLKPPALTLERGG